jgi:hypothetical protein
VPGRSVTLATTPADSRYRRDAWGAWVLCAASLATLSPGAAASRSPLSSVNGTTFVSTTMTSSRHPSPTVLRMCVSDTYNSKFKPTGLLPPESDCVTTRTLLPGGGVRKDRACARTIDGVTSKVIHRLETSRVGSAVRLRFETLSGPSGGQPAAVSDWEELDVTIIGACPTKVASGSFVDANGKPLNSAEVMAAMQARQ